MVLNLWYAKLFLVVREVFVQHLIFRILLFNLAAQLHSFNKNLILFIFYFFKFFYLIIYLRPKSVHICTHTQKKNKKRNINPKRCTIEKYMFKTKFAQNIGNKTIYTISPMTLMT